MPLSRRRRRRITPGPWMVTPFGPGYLRIESTGPHGDPLLVAEVRARGRSAAARTRAAADAILIAVSPALLCAAIDAARGLDPAHPLHAAIAAATRQEV